MKLLEGVFIRGDSINTIAIGINSRYLFGLFIKPTDSTFDLNIFPNPVQEELIVEASALRDIQFTVYSNTGQVIKPGVKDQESSFNIDVRDFSPGVYYLQIRMDGRIVNKKFIKS